MGDTTRPQLQDLLGQETYAKYLSYTAGASFFDIPLEDMTSEEVRCMVGGMLWQMGHGGSLARHIPPADIPMETRAK